jgi:hypothetical protein
MTRHLTALAAAAAIGCLCTIAHATGANRVWVSGKGSDAPGCGAPTAPCRSLQYAHDNIVATGGEIDILDPAGYGAITITKAISIVNDGVGTAGVQSGAGNSAVTVNAGAGDSIYLRGLNIDGVQYSGATGILLNTGGSLKVVNCVVRHFNANGIEVRALGTGLTSVTISDTLVSDNNGIGVLFDTPTTGTGWIVATVDHVISTQNEDGIDFDMQNASTFWNRITLANVVANNNNGFGVAGQGLNPGGTGLMVDSSYTNYNGSASSGGGIGVAGPMGVYLSRSIVAGNPNYGVGNGTSPNSFYTAGNNWIVSNTTDIDLTTGAPMLTTQPLQ